MPSVLAPGLICTHRSLLRARSWKTRDVQARITNSGEGHRMLDASRRHAHLVAQIVPSPMTLAFDRTIGDMIGSGYIGDLISLDARVAAGGDFPNYDAPIVRRPYPLW